MNTPKNPIVVGKLGSSYGIKGWLRVFSFTENAETLFAYLPWCIKRAGQWQHIEVESWRMHNQDYIVKLKNIDDRDEANALTNNEIFVDAEQLPQLPSGEYYWKDLIGCQVWTDKGYHLGQVTDLMETGSNDVLVIQANVKDAYGVRERLVPYLEGQVIKSIDLSTQKMVVDWDPGF